MKRYSGIIVSLLLLLLSLLATTLFNNGVEGAFVVSKGKNGKLNDGVIEKNDIHHKIVQRYSNSRRHYHVTSKVFMSNDNKNDYNNNNNIDTNNDSTTLDIVLMSVGDLRVDDHIGYQNALSNVKTTHNKILPIVALTNDILSNIPGIIAHTIDTTNILVDAITDINESLQSLTQSSSLSIHPTTMKLHYLQGSIVQSSLQQMLVVEQQKGNTFNKIRIHVCDLGDADNNMGYDAYSQLMKDNDNNNNDEWEIIPWTSNLRTQPWQDISSKFTDKYPEYVTKYTKSVQPIEPVDLDSDTVKLNDDNIINIKEYQNLPTYENLLQHIQTVLSLESDRCQSEKSTGMYCTHWGGVQSNSIKGSNVLQTISSFVRDYKENDIQWMKPNQFQTQLQVSYNTRSLEHASMKWQLQNNNNWMAGESITRYLAAPILYGTISVRRLWYIANENSNVLLDDSSVFFPSSSIKQLVEGSEWHKLLATKYIRTDPSYAIDSSTSSNNIPQQTTYKYWRYQGFLCRYAITNFNSNNNNYENKFNQQNNNRNGIILVHGFGASGSQWNKVMSEIGTCINDSKNDDETIICQQGLAPDLIGFGHSEKPGISYTGYMWDSQISDFCKEIALVQQKLNTFIIGGNSIGGFTSLSAAASDTASIIGHDVSSNGSPGTLRCSGLVLMNSAGPIKTANEIQIEMTKSSSSSLSSIAIQTINGQLKPCSPPPRPVARAFGNVLLGYLRPQIQSICKNLYPTNPDAVDTILCEGILRDSLDPGAVYVMMAGAKLPTPRTANELLNAQFGNGSTSTSTSASTNSITESVFTGPVLIAQGVLDPLNDAMDRMNRFSSLRDGITPDPIQAGHCPHDEQPNLVAKSIVSWMNLKQPFGIISSSASVSRQYQGSSSMLN